MSVKKLLYGAITKKNTTANTSYTTNINTTASTAVETSINTTWQTSWMSGPTTTTSTTYNSTWNTSYQKATKQTELRVSHNTYISTKVGAGAFVNVNNIGSLEGEFFLDPYNAQYVRTAGTITWGQEARAKAFCLKARSRLGHYPTWNQYLQLIQSMTPLMKNQYSGLKWYPKATDPTEPDTSHPDYLTQQTNAITIYANLASDITLADGTRIIAAKSKIADLPTLCRSYPNMSLAPGWSFDGYLTCTINTYTYTDATTLYWTSPFTTMYTPTSMSVTRNTSWVTGGGPQAKNTSMVTLGQASRNTTKITLGNTSHSTTWSTSL